MSKYYRHTNELVLLMPIMFRWVPKIEHFEVQLCIFSTKGTVPRILFVIILIDNVTHRFLTCLGERLNETLNIFKIWKNIYSFSISFLKFLKTNMSISEFPLHIWNLLDLKGVFSKTYRSLRSDVCTSNNSCSF